jgi:methyltransferase (TIGR00027 family)
MARTDQGTWDLASSVGATATVVAVGRALASRSANALIDDPFAEPLVRAVGVRFFTRVVSGELDPAVADGGAGYGLTRLTRMMAVRTRLIDDYFDDACAAGIRQAVILAAGLDARAYRLPWPAGTTVYEIDQPEVIEFKTRALARIGAAPTAQRRIVAIDLRRDWAAALRASGFDPSQPTVWSAEGLVDYLPGDAQDRLLDEITELSARGSRFIAANVPGNDEAAAALQEHIGEAIDNWRKHGFDVAGMGGLWYVGERHDLAAYLAERGWTTTHSTMADKYELYGQPLSETGEDTLGLGSTIYVTGIRMQRS